ncbi:MAG: Asp-tRNA(Asn)/Glu-tRNA(Gln) amidotransferase subunit GatC [Chlamydiae bacterium]|nr:Asp-tRNA(Asn)/Glu-tRNA(Gln) amidotransferase subunit GatC [Chlamydiota bacterium]MBI3277196.1 Asp-tRNA(Asn)/Glu-tRNA(Gln) amidotransferase subunit GatC [Chlamydiota bacterium]
MNVQKNIDDVAKLARLRLSAVERDKFSRQLEDILSYVENLNELKTEGVLPSYHVQEVKNVTRPDESRPSLDPNSFLKHAPQARDGFFIVPQVIE